MYKKSSDRKPIEFHTMVRQKNVPCEVCGKPVKLTFENTNSRKLCFKHKKELTPKIPNPKGEYFYNLFTDKNKNYSLPDTDDVARAWANSEQTEKYRKFIGIDVGRNGGISIIDSLTNEVTLFSMPKTEKELWKIIKENVDETSKVVIEKVWSSPQMGVVSAFSFGHSYGKTLMTLIAAEADFIEVTPQQWQKFLGVSNVNKLPKNEHKKNLLLSSQKVVHDNEYKLHNQKLNLKTADAMLLAEYSRQSGN